MHRRWGRRETAFALAVFGLAAAVRFYFRNPDALALDEAVSVLIAERSPRELLAALSRDGNPPLYYLILRAWIEVFGISETSVRTLSVFLGALFPPMIYAVGRAVFGPVVGAFAAVLAIVSPLHVYYSQQVRMYALLPVASLAFFFSVYAVATRRGKGAWVLLASTTAAVMWTHNYGLFLVAAAPIAWWVLAPADLGSWRAFASALLAGTLLYAPWMPVVLRQAQTGVSSFIAPLFERRGAVLAIPEALLYLSAGYRFPDYLYGLGQAWSAPAPAILWLSLTCAACAAAMAAGQSYSRPLVAALSLTIGTLIVALFASVAIKPVLLLGRYEIVVLPLFLLFLAGGLGWLYERPGRASRLAAAALVVMFIAMSARSLQSYADAPPNRISERIAQTIAKSAKSGDAVVITGLVRAPVEYYLQLAREPVGIHSFPAAIGEHPGWYDPSPFLESEQSLIDEVAALTRDRSATSALFLVEHAASPAIQQVNRVLHEELARVYGEPQPLYAAGPDPAAAPLFLVVRYAPKAPSTASP